MLDRPHNVCVTKSLISVQLSSPLACWHSFDSQVSLMEILAVIWHKMMKEIAKSYLSEEINLRFPGWDLILNVIQTPGKSDWHSCFNLCQWMQVESLSSGQTAKVEIWLFGGGRHFSKTLARCWSIIQQNTDVEMKKSSRTTSMRWAHMSARSILNRSKSSSRHDRFQDTAMSWRLFSAAYCFRKTSQPWWNILFKVGLNPCRRVSSSSPSGKAISLFEACTVYGAEDEYIFGRLEQSSHSSFAHYGQVDTTQQAWLCEDSQAQPFE